jgi:hypothetical protein
MMPFFMPYTVQRQQQERGVENNHYESLRAIHLVKNTGIVGHQKQGEYHESHNAKKRINQHVPQATL